MDGKLPLNLPPESPRVRIDDPDFDRLTPAEKLNDSKYRSLIYRKYPNEPTCGCESALTNGSPTAKDKQEPAGVKLLVCPGGCKNQCCTRKRHKRVPESQDNTNDDKVPRFPPSYCVGNQKSSQVYNGTSCPEERMRGGGCEGETYRRSSGIGRMECPRHVWNVMGTGDNLQSNRKCPASDYYYASRSKKINDFDTFLPNTTADCFYPPRKYAESLSSPPLKSHREACTKKPCSGVDCLIRTLKETEEFVDSLGRVPGMAGLGLMDPSESPYFKTDFRLNKVPKRIPQIPQTPMRHTRTEKSPCPAIYNPHVKLNSPNSQSMSFGMPRDLVIPRWREVSMKEGEEKDLAVDDKEDGPCGESACKSRRRKTSKDDVSSLSENLKLSHRRKHSKRRHRAKKHSKQRRRKMRSSSLGDRFQSRLVGNARYVYVTGNSYPGSSGHKNCADLRKRVPAHMGWLWNNYEALGRLKPRVGWRPGAISRQMQEIIMETKALMVRKGSRPQSIPSRGKSLKINSSKSYTSVKKNQVKKSEVYEEEVEPPPTFHLERRDGTYYVTMYPIKQDTMDIPKLEVPMKPMEIKIIKNRNDSSTSSSIPSDMKIDFSPPAAVNRYRKKPNLIHIGTQVKDQEILNAFKPDGDQKEKKSKKKKK